MASSGSQVPRGRPGGHQLRREVIVHHQRERILSAAVELVAERGYRSISVGDIVKRAAIARAKFYENFSSKEDCFFAAYDRATAEAQRRVAEACAQSEGAFPERLHAGLAAFLEYLSADPALARACIVEAPSVGPAAEERRDQALRGFVDLIRSGRERAGEPEIPETVEESVLGGLYWLIYHAILNGRPKRLEDLLPELTEFSLIPFVGADAARDAAQTLSASAS